jgi:hypothetical protein
MRERERERARERVDDNVYTGQAEEQATKNPPILSITLSNIVVERVEEESRRS